MSASTPRPKEPALYTKYEAAAILGIKVSWLERKAAARLIPFTMLGGYRFTAEHLAEIIRINEQHPQMTTPTSRQRAPRQRVRSRQRVPASTGGAMPLRARPKMPPGQRA